jgi:hypothetical protein
VTKFDSGTSPSRVRVLSVSSVERTARLLGEADADLDLVVGGGHRMVSSRMPRVTSCTIAPTVATSAP